MRWREVGSETIGLHEAHEAPNFSVILGSLPSIGETTNDLQISGNIVTEAVNAIERAKQLTIVLFAIVLQTDTRHRVPPRTLRPKMIGMPEISYKYAQIGQLLLLRCGMIFTARCSYRAIRPQVSVQTRAANLAATPPPAAPR